MALSRMLSLPYLDDGELFLDPVSPLGSYELDRVQAVYMPHTHSCSAVPGVGEITRGLGAGLTSFNEMPPSDCKPLLELCAESGQGKPIGMIKGAASI